MNPIQQYLREVRDIAEKLDVAVIGQIVRGLTALRDRGGRLFILGVGGSAANASHAVNDFRKICGIESYAPTDNVSELTARTNDEGWPGVFAAWLETSRLNQRDALLVLSVGGGDAGRNISPNLVEAVKLAKARGASVFGIVGRDGGYTASVGDAVVIVPTVNPAAITPHTEAFQAVVWHLLVSHPDLKRAETKWEGTPKPMARAVFLDRDGVLNPPVVRDGLPFPPASLAEFQVYPEAREACALLHQAGFLLVVVTNQPDVGRGALPVDLLDAMHARLMEQLPLDRIEVCAAAGDNSPDARRRKPAPGMLLDAAAACGIDLARSYLIGDRWRDIDCGRAAGCTTIFIDRHYVEKLKEPPHHSCPDMLAAARLILSLEKEVRD